MESLMANSITQTKEKCQVKGCKKPAYIGYYNKVVCMKHWDLHCSENKKYNIKLAFNIKE